MACAASRPSTSSSSVVPFSAASSKRSGQNLPSTGWPSLRETVTFDSKRAASSANAAAGRTCSPSGFITTTVRRNGPLALADGPLVDPALLSRPLTLQQRPDLILRFGLTQLLHELFVPHAANDVLQRPQVVAGPVLGRDEQDQHMHGLTVDAVERNPRLRQRDRSNQLVHARVLRVGDGDVAADARRAQLLAPHDRPHNLVGGALGEEA